MINETRARRSAVVYKTIITLKVYPFECLAILYIFILQIVGSYLEEQNLF